ncbi:MAG: DEAD/DEAH box helicase [Chloroflexota bacterium]
MSDSLFFQGGTLVLREASEQPPISTAFRWIKGHWRCEGYHYGALAPKLHEAGIRDTVPRWEHLGLTLQDLRQPHAYQTEALRAWDEAGQRGSIVLPTGAGKTFVAIHAISQVDRSAVVIAPTIDLLHQWYARLVNAFGVDIGVYYGGEKHILPLTVTTYHSAGDLIAAYGNTFKLIIFDEVHHLPAPSWGEMALMAPCPLRLGLTATYPEAHEQTDGRWRVDELVGPIVYTQRIDDLVGHQLANYRTERIRVNLNEDEQTRYGADYAIYAGYIRAEQFQRKYGAGWLRELMRRSAFNEGARRALLARQRIIRLLSGAEGKMIVLEKLLKECFTEQVLIFTENNSTAYEISRRHLIPAITHETKAAERKHILEAFQARHYKAIVTSKVLNEGVDVPEAKVAIILGGTSAAREYIQRLGRVLRKVENREALLFEVIVRGTVEEGKAQRRRKQSNAHR